MMVCEQCLWNSCMIIFKCKNDFAHSPYNINSLYIIIYTYTFTFQNIGIYV